ncbi:hypothetical protein N7E02_19695 [Aliirhizobium terrae]|uniref:hypothetical protein n=1 Tax=Terrirhizobium terrae TaxID=2926709 RepID=UPI0025752A82|nr:hypothetical protein [Rhizobium sp. CC-CFT758]WJH39106.1 hypothetical protein N7E02_19695 [Rhizobium sp. CC-CFT758]
MTMTPTKPLAKATTSIFGSVLVTLTLAGCTTAGEDRYDDRRRCSHDRYYDDCMYMQQHRRDREQLMNQEKALINAEQARENLRMLREIRRRRGD